MKDMSADDAYYDVLEIEESDFMFSASSCRRFEDSNDIGGIGDNIAFAIDDFSDFELA